MNQGGAITATPAVQRWGSMGSNSAGYVAGGTQASQVVPIHLRSVDDSLRRRSMPENRHKNQHKQAMAVPQILNLNLNLNLNIILNISPALLRKQQQQEQECSVTAPPPSPTKIPRPAPAPPKPPPATAPGKSTKQRRARKLAYMRRLPPRYKKGGDLITGLSNIPEECEEEEDDDDDEDDTEEDENSVTGLLQRSASYQSQGDDAHAHLQSTVVAPSTRSSVSASSAARKIKNLLLFRSKSEGQSLDVIKFLGLNSSSHVSGSESNSGSGSSHHRSSNMVKSRLLSLLGSKKHDRLE